MAVFTLPAAWWPQSAAFGLRQSAAVGRSPFNGRTSHTEFPGHRWYASITIPGRARVDVPGLESTLLQVCGRPSNQLRLPHLGRRDWVPAGTLRGSPVLTSAAAKGADSLAITAVGSTNLLATAGMENDTDADGLADDWSLYTAGTTSGVTTAREADVPAAGLWSQFIAANALGTTSADRIGIWQRVDLGGSAAGLPLTVSARMRGDKPSQLTVHAVIRDAALASLATITTSDTCASRYAWQQVEASSTALPAGARYADVFVWQSTGDGGASYLSIDSVRCVLAAPQPAVTLLADDLIKAGGQLFMVAADVEFDAYGQATVPLVNRVRADIASGSAVTWNKPTVDMYCPASASLLWTGSTRDLRYEPLALDLEEYVP